MRKKTGRLRGTTGAAKKTRRGSLVEIDSNTKRRFLKVGRRVVGEVRGDVFVKPIQFSKHHLRFCEAFALEAGNLRQITRLGVQTIELRDRESQRIFRIPLALFDEKKFALPDFGHGRQLACRLRHWETIEPEAGQ